MNSNSKRGGITTTHIILLLICAASMNVINRFYFFIFFAVGALCLNPKRKIHIESVPCLMLFLLAANWILFSPESTASIFAPLKPFTYFLCYIMGSSLLNDDEYFSEKRTTYKLFYYVVVAIGLGSLFHYLLNWLSNFGSIERNTVDFWSKEILAATAQASFACIPLAIAIASFFTKNTKGIKIAATITVALVLVYNLILAGRTLILLTLIVTAVALIHKLSHQKKGRGKTLLIVVLVITFIIILYQFDIFGIRTLVEGSPLYERFFAEDSVKDLDEDSRMDKKLYYLQNWDQFLWGGTNMRENVGHAHDIFLDTYDEAGIFAFIAILIYLIITIVHLVRCLKDKSLPFAFRQTVLCVYVMLYSEFMVEPILQGLPFLFASFCLIDGYVSRILTHHNNVLLSGGDL